MLDKVSKLLAKAEATDSAPERDAYLEKAQALATTYAIDLEVARQRQRSERERQRPTCRRIHLGEPRASNLRHFALLFTVIARANDLHCLVARNSTYVEPYGFASDIDVSERLYASVAVQMKRAADAAIDAGEHYRRDNLYRGRAGALRADARVFRSNFYDGFVAALHARLTAARERAQRQHREQVVLDEGGRQVSVSGELVLVRKREEVGAFFAQACRDQRVRGTWNGGGTSTLVRGAHAQGRAAGERADLHDRTAVGGTRRALHG